MDKTWRVGQVVWRELMTPDVNKAKGFYGELLGWSFADMPMGEHSYTIIKRGDKQVGGMMQSTPEMGPPAWLSYVSVEDVGEAIAATKARGGISPMGPNDVPGVGVIGIIGDPTGGFVGLLRGTDGDAPAGAGMPAVGEFCWETLNTTDVEKAKAFYTEVIGWTVKAMTANMNVLCAGECMVADIEAAQPGVPSHWLSHVVVEKLEPARERAEKLGATVLVPVIDIPTVGRICLVKDTVGAVISLFEPGQPAA